MFTMRFTMRSAPADPSVRAGSYAAMLDMVAWAETRGGVAAMLSRITAPRTGSCRRRCR